MLVNPQKTIQQFRVAKVILLLFVLWITKGSAQNSTQLILDFKFENSSKQIKKLAYKQFHVDTALANVEIRNVVNTLVKMGFINALAKDYQFENNIVSSTIYTGKNYDVFTIRKFVFSDSIDVISKIKSRGKYTFTAKELFGFKRKIIDNYEQQGYPFAEVMLDSVEYGEQSVVADLKIIAHQKIKIDSINIYGNATISRKYLFKYLGVKPNDLYNENIIQNINARIKELPFVNETKPYKVIFTKKYAKLLLNIEKKKANKFDGFLGFLPDEKTGKINFTGQANIKLLNTLAHGENIEIEWRKLQLLTQDLKTNFTYPYIFNLPFGIEHTLKLYKRDTTFIDVANTLGIQYLLSAGNSIKFFVGKRNINLINTAGYEFTTTLPEFADISSTSYGIATNLNFTDYKLNPRKGFKTIITAAAATRQINKNQIFNPMVYDNLELVTQQYSVQGNIGYFFPILKKSTILFDAKFAKIIGSNIFTNELYRIGGLVSLRGFDEESIYASAYLMPSIEYRFLFDKNSAIFLFGNAAYYENISRNKRIIDRPFGFGTGIFFETKAGIFSLTYALGKQFYNPILVRNAKIHFGLVSVF